mgnify:CR=1 FL=1
MPFKLDFDWNFYTEDELALMKREKKYALAKSVLIKKYGKKIVYTDKKKITFHDLGFKMGFDEKDEDAAELCIDEQNKNFV